MAGGFLFSNREPTIYCLQEAHFRVKDTQTEGKGMEKDFSYKQKLQESRGSKTHIRQKRVKTKAVKKDKEGHYIMIKGPIQEENITFVNMYVPEMTTHSSILAWKIPQTSLAGSWGCKELDTTWRLNNNKNIGTSKYIKQIPKTRKGRNQQQYNSRRL